MNVLIFGDVVGRPGREALLKIIPKLKKEFEVDLVIANGENMAHGSGVTEKTVKEMLDGGVDFITSGDHIWDRKEVVALLNDPETPVIRPANYPPGNRGAGYKILHVNGTDIAVVNIMGRVFFRVTLDCPFRKIDQILEEIGDKAKVVIVDFHAEATSEKKAMGLYLDGRVSLVFGTHTHIPTADFEVLNGGTAYVTDVGMVGPKDSVIGADKRSSLEHFLLQLPFEYKIAESKDAEVNALVVKIDEKSGQASQIQRIRKTVPL